MTLLSKGSLEGSVTDKVLLRRVPFRKVTPFEAR